MTLNKKIYLIRSNQTNFGGAENYLSRLSKALFEENIEHEIIHFSFPKLLPSWAKAIIFNIYLRIHKGGKFYYSLDRITCADLYRAGDGVHKVYLSIEKKSKLNLLHPVYLYLEKHCFNNANFIIANSKMVREEIINTYNINPNKISVVHNGIEFKTIDYKKSFDKLSVEFSIKKSQPIILFVGSGFKRKGVEEFLEIVSRIKNSSVKAFIIGKEKNLKYYQNLSKKLKLNDKIIFTGPRNDVDDFYTIGDILIFPTHYDPFSNVILEAMYFGNAVFTTKRNGASEVLGKDFIMQEPNDTTVISMINNLLTNEKLLNAEKIKNKEISRNFSIKKNLNQTLQIINKFD